jgi:hypothetical protein
MQGLGAHAGRTAQESGAYGGAVSYRNAGCNRVRHPWEAEELSTRNS